MRILIITQYFWPENFKINDFALTMKERGHDVSVLTGIPNYPEGKFYKKYGYFYPKFELYDGVKVYRTILFPRKNSNGFWLFLNYVSFAFFSSFAILFRLNKKFDLIFVWEISPITVGIPAILLKKLQRIPIFFWVLDLWPENVFAASKMKSETLKKYINILVKFIYNNCDKIFVSSEGFIKPIILNGIDPHKIEYIPNWAENIYLYDNKEIRPDLDCLLPESAQFIILFAGNIGESQDFESVLNAATILKSNVGIKWVIIGDGRKRTWLINEIKKRELNDSVYALGKFSINDMPYFYSKADALLISLKNENVLALTLPAKLMTYMAYGKPILAMASGETRRVVEDAKSGLACESGHYRALAQNVILLLGMNTMQKDKFSQNSVNYYNTHFQKEKVINRIENILIDDLVKLKNIKCLLNNNL